MGTPTQGHGAGLEGATAAAARLDAQIKITEADLAAAKLAQDSAHEAVADTRARWSEVNQRLQSARETLDRTARSQQDLAATDARLAREAEGHTARVATLTAEVTEGDRALRGLLLNLEELRRRKVTLRRNSEGSRAKSIAPCNR